MATSVKRDLQSYLPHRVVVGSDGQHVTFRCCYCHWRHQHYYLVARYLRCPLGALPALCGYVLFIFK